MDQRRESRLEADQAVVVTVLGKQELKQTALVRNASGRGLAVEMPREVAPGAALKIELDDAIVLGEAVYCKEEKGGYLVGVELDQVLCSLSQLGRKLQEFADLQSGRQVPHTMEKRKGQHRE